MATKIIENNKLYLKGVVTTPFEYSHEVCGEKFYIVYISIERTSGIADVIPVMVSERMVDVNSNFIGEWISVEGNYRSYNCLLENKNHLILTAFAREFELVEDGVYEENNSISIEGFLCKRPVYRITPKGREVADLLIAVNRSYGRTDYIPCICWSRNARFASGFEVGDKIKICGRVQSREYTKYFDDGKEPEIRTAYEVSCTMIERV